jgi:hypothetical protein
LIWRWFANLFSVFRAREPVKAGGAADGRIDDDR